MGGSGLDSSGSGVVGSCEHGIEASQSIKHGNFLSGFSAPWSYLINELFMYYNGIYSY
jgi:hypothetical protein